MVARRYGISLLVFNSEHSKRNSISTRADVLFYIEKNFRGDFFKILVYLQ